jgi:hypothetical protein
LHEDGTAGWWNSVGMVGLESFEFQVPNADLGCPSLIRAACWV